MKKTVKPDVVPETWNPEALYAKAQRYAERIHGADGEDWEKALWAGLSLELLARAALANVSPVLLAEASDKHWQNLLDALGFSPTESKFSPKSIATGEVFRRLSKIFPEFTKENENFCSLFTGKRNAELHSGEPAFNGLPTSSWQPKYYLSCSILLNTVGLELKDFIGTTETATASKLIAALADDSAKEVHGEVSEHAKDWAKKSSEEQRSLSIQAMAWAIRPSGHRVPCPACKSNALIGGEAIGPTNRKLNGNLILETQEFLPTHFECIACGLKISGLSKLSVAGVGNRFKKTAVYDAAEFYAPEDESEYAGFDDDNNEPL